jgi:flagella basal body P-ring formation protein FlgA
MNDRHFAAPDFESIVSLRCLALGLIATIALSVEGAAHGQVVAALDQVRPKLKAEAVVTGAIVHIGDLVAHAGIVSNVPIFRSPDLGSTGTVSADAVVEAVRAHSLIGLDTGGIDEVVVTRAARTIEPQEIESVVTAALSARFALGAPGDVAVNFDSGISPLKVELTATGAPRVTHLAYDPRSAHFDATVDVPGHAPLQLTGEARAMMNVIALARPVKRGEILKSADLVVERHARNQAGRNVVTDYSAAIGLAARNTMPAGRMLHATDLMKPQIIQRNEMVTLVYRAPGITLTVRGKAAEGGAEGDVISVLNEQSKRTLQGVVAGPGRVVIDTRGRRLAANILPASADTPRNAR